MKKILLSILLLLPLTLFAQKFPTDPETGLITYTEVVPVEGKSQKELYTAARSWIATAFKSANHVVQMDTEDKIVVKGITPYFTQSLGATVASDLHFTAIIELKDGKYKYTVTHYKTDANSPVETGLLHPKVIYKKDGTVKGYYEPTVKAIEKAMLELNESIKSGIASPSNNSDW